jgi:hypothetical protein
VKIVFALLVYLAPNNGLVDITLFQEQDACEREAKRFNAKWSPKYVASCSMMDVR